MGIPRGVQGLHQDLALRMFLLEKAECSGMGCVQIVPSLQPISVLSVS